MNTNSAIKELKATKETLAGWISQIDATINMLHMVSSFNLPPNAINGVSVLSHTASSETTNNLGAAYKTYNPNSTMVDKVVFVLKAENKFLHIREIAGKLHELEPQISVKEFTSKMYPAFAILKKNGAITKIIVGESNLNTFWGSKNWLNEDGTIKNGHEYNENEVQSFGNKTIEI